MEKILICKKDYFAPDLTFDRGAPYRVVGEHKTTNGLVLEVLGLDDKAVLMDEKAVEEFFFEDAPGSLYAIRRFSDELPGGEYGVNDQFYLVGAFSDRDYAIDEWKALNAEADEGERYELFVFVPDRLYLWHEQPWLGGGCYFD